jgi:hypothetical protein
MTPEWQQRAMGVSQRNKEKFGSTLLPVKAKRKSLQDVQCNNA